VFPHKIGFSCISSVRLIQKLYVEIMLLVENNHIFGGSFEYIGILSYFIAAELPACNCTRRLRKPNFEYMTLQQWHLAITARYLQSSALIQLININLKAFKVTKTEN